MPYDKDFARICAWLKKHRLTAHTDRNGKTVLRSKNRQPFRFEKEPARSTE